MLISFNDLFNVLFLTRTGSCTLPSASLWLLPVAHRLSPLFPLRRSPLAAPRCSGVFRECPTNPVIVFAGGKKQRERRVRPLIREAKANSCRCARAAELRVSLCVRRDGADQPAASRARGRARTHTRTLFTFFVFTVRCTFYCLLFIVL